MSRTLVTSALPYANGPVHFGHLVGAYLPADVYTRTLRMLGEEVLFVCGADEYGVAITLGAEAESMSFSEYAAKWRDTIKGTFDELGIEFDIWSGTSKSKFHTEFTQDFFRRLHSNGYLAKKESEQLYCPKDSRYLADRYVKGTCPKCGHEGARGDECPACGSWLEALSLINPLCGLCGTTPERRTTAHWYLDMPKLRDEFIGEWIAEHDWKPNVGAFIQNMLADAPQRAITRDLDWGIEVPAEILGGETGKVIYVWFDAPIGYVSFTAEWAEEQGTPEAWKDWWQSPDTRLVHFIGKDNIPFHTMLFPAMLYGVKQEYVLPWQVPANEFYNLQGRKFSTSNNWSIPLAEFFERYDNEAARFYLISSMPETADSEWKWEEFQRCVNKSLADTIGNLVTRVLRFIVKRCDGDLPTVSAEHASEFDRILLQECGAIGDPADHVREFHFRRASEQLIANAAVANVFIDRVEPWSLIKSDPERGRAALSTAAQFIAWIARWMTPFMPGKAQEIWEMLGGTEKVAEMPWPGTPTIGDWRSLPEGRALGEVRGLFDKLDDESIEAEVQALHKRAL
ncbi:MAG: methionyl-tRNA synthetase [Planctomycetota bacterium]